MDLGADVASAPQVKIVMDALSEFPVTPAGIARRATFGLPAKLEVQDPSGAWRSVTASVGSVPTAPEFTRTYVFDLTSAVRGTTGKVRFTYLFRTLIDYIAVDTSPDEPLTLPRRRSRMPSSPTTALTRRRVPRIPIASTTAPSFAMAPTIRAATRVRGRL